MTIFKQINKKIVLVDIRLRNICSIRTVSDQNTLEPCPMYSGVNGFSNNQVRDRK